MSPITTALIAAKTARWKQKQQNVSTQKQWKSQKLNSIQVLLIPHSLRLPLPEPDVVGLDVATGSKNMQSSAKNAKQKFLGTKQCEARSSAWVICVSSYSKFVSSSISSFGSRLPQMMCFPSLRNCTTPEERRWSKGPECIGLVRGSDVIHCVGMRKNHLIRPQSRASFKARM